MPPQEIDKRFKLTDLLLQSFKYSYHTKWRTWAAWEDLSRMRHGIPSAIEPADKLTALEER